MARNFRKRVLLVDRRAHVGGNAYDHANEAGVLVHQAMDRTFSTQTQTTCSTIFPNLRRGGTTSTGCSHGWQTNWCRYRLTSILSTGSTDSNWIRMRWRHICDKVGEKRTGSHYIRGCHSRSGGARSLRKDVSRLYPQAVGARSFGTGCVRLTARIPVRLNRDDRYFSDTYQAMPLHGFTRMFENMLDHPNITISLNTDYRDILTLSSLPRTGLYRPGGRILRLPLWEAAVPVSAVPP